MKLVVGLGNPGFRYENTRHNIGFRVVDRLAVEYGFTFRKSWLTSALYAKVRVGNEDLLILKPLTYMNRSGRAVKWIMRRRKMVPQDVLVILDDIELPFGRLRIRQKGSAGSHNGLKSIIEELGTENFARVRVGIGRDSDVDDLAAYVLSDFPPELADDVDALTARAVSAIIDFAVEGPERAMNTFNK